MLYKNKYRVASTRLPGWSYTGYAYYFITICTRNREHFFGRVADGRMMLNEAGRTAYDNWRAIPAHYPHVILDEFIVMPNHIHGILIWTPSEDAGPVKRIFGPLQKGSLSGVMQQYMASVTRIRRKNDDCIFGWQGGFYDHIIRSMRSLHRIRRYIRMNPVRWQAGKE